MTLHPAALSTPSMTSVNTPEQLHIAEYSVPTFDDDLRKAVEDPDTIDETYDSHSSSDLFSHRRLAMGPVGTPSVPKGSKELQPLHRALDRLQSRADPVRREHRLYKDGHPGSRLKWLIELVERSNPSPGTLDDIVSFDGHVPGLGPILRFLFSPDQLEEENYNWLGPFRDRVANAARLAASDVDSRLAMRASTAWVLHRYARRSRRLHCRFLRALIDESSDNRSAEIKLTEDAALFMSDQGFEVVTELSLGQHRYDLVGSAILIEAKIYGRNSRSGLKVIADGLKHCIGTPHPSRAKAPTWNQYCCSSDWVAATCRLLRSTGSLA